MSRHAPDDPPGAFGQTSADLGTGARWNGSTWRLSDLPGAFSRPSDVSASGPANVWADGSRCIIPSPGIPASYATYVTRYNGHSWQTKTWKSSKSATPCTYGALVTTGPRNTWLLGSGQAEHFTGRSWQHLSIPVLGQAEAVAAVSADDIWALSGRFNGAHPQRDKTFFVRYNGRTWQRSPLPAIKLPKNGYLVPDSGFAVSSNHSIWASVGIEPGGSRSYLLHFNGNSWQSIAVPAHPEEVQDVASDGAGGVWVVMFQTATGATS